LKVTATSIWLLDPVTNTLTCEQATGERSENVRNWRLKLGEGLAGSAARNRESIIVPDTRMDNRYVKDVNQSTGLELRSILTVPLKSKENVIGVIQVVDTTVNRFDKTHQTLLESLSSSATIAIENARLYEQRSTDIAALQEINEAVISKDRDEILRLIVEKATEVLHGEHGELWLIAPDTGDLLLEAAHGAGKEAAERIGRIEAGEDSFNMQVVRTRKSHICSDIGKKKTGFLRIYHQARSSVTVPLKYQGRVIGTLNVESSRLSAFTEENRDLLDSFSDQAAIAIQNARLYEQLQQEYEQRSKDIAALQEINKAVVTEEYSKTLQLIVDKTTAITGANYGVLRLVDDSDQLLVLQAWSGRERRKDPLPIGGQSFTGQVALNQKSELCPDVRQNKYYLKWYDEVMSCMAAPLMYGERLIGTLYVESERLGAFSEQRQTDLLQSFADQAAVAIENARLYEQRVEDISALQEINKAITREPPEEIMDLVAQKAQELTGAAYASLWLANEERTHLTRQTICGRESTVDELPLDETSANGWVLITGRPQRIRDIESVTGENIHYLRYSQEWRSDLVVPLKIGKQPIGTINVQSPIPNLFSDYHERLLQTLADQAAIALENAHLYEQRSKDMAALQEINEAVVSKDRDEILRLIVEKATEVLHGEHGELWLIAPNTGDLLLEAAHGAVKEAAERIGRIEAGDDSFNMQVVWTKKPYICSEIDKKETGFVRLYHQARSSVTVPLKYQEQVIGTLNVESAQLDAFTEEHKNLLVSFADQAAVAIENSQLYEQLQQTNAQLDRKVQNLQALYAMGQRLTSGLQLSEQEILDLIHETASQLMDTANMYIARYDASTDTVSFPLMYVDGEPMEVAARSGGAGRTEWIIRNRESILIYTRDASEAWYKGHRTDYIDEPFASWVGVPMLSGDNVLGVIAAYHKTDDYVYDENDQEILSLMANQAAVALKSAQQIEIMKDLSVDLTAGVLGS
jgi:GAF domain-containing protein